MNSFSMLVKKNHGFFGITGVFSLGFVCECDTRAGREVVRVLSVERESLLKEANTVFISQFLG